MFMQSHREEKSDEGDRGGQEEKSGNQKERDRSSHSVPQVFSTAQNPRRDSPSWVEKKRGRGEIEVACWRKRRVKRGREQSGQ